MRVFHPTLQHISYDVNPENLGQWVESGWVPEVVHEPEPEIDEESAWNQANKAFKSKRGTLTQNTTEDTPDGN